MIGKTLGRYQITAKLGEGGMGVVYQAEDPELRRRVALKVLPKAMAAEPERLKRFKREARAVATLNHPNVVTIYSVEKADDVHLITMELVEGRSLDRGIPPNGFELARLFDLAIQVADALAAAHGRGLVHRDLKPANVMLTEEGRIKILDFGLAKLVEAEGVPEATRLATEALTQEGQVVGTIPYMSPEQLEGKPLDHRTDIFSLGVLLYEMAAGSRPFQGESSPAVMSSILRDLPRPVTEINARLPRHLGRIIHHCLEKDPERRYQSAKDVRNELQGLRDEVRSGTVSAVSEMAPPAPASEVAPAKVIQERPPRRGLWVAGAAALLVVAAAGAFWLGRRAERPGPEAGEPESVATAAGRYAASIAVLPFVNTSEDASNAYFSEGLSNELLSLLAKIPGLKVAARTSSFSFQGKKIDVATIAERLNVSTVLEGDVQKVGNRVRIRARLVNAADGFQLWSNSYDRQLDDIFAVQDDIARSVAGALEVTLLGGEIGGLAGRPTDVEAYNLTLQGQYFYNRGTAEDLEKAVDCYERALALDPDYAPAWAKLAQTRFWQGGRGLLSIEESIARAREATERAVELDENLAEAWASLGNIKQAYDWDWAGAEAAVQRALALEPGNTVVVRRTASLAATLGRFDEALELDRRAAELDPLSGPAHVNRANHAYRAGRLEEAEAAVRQAMELNPEATVPHIIMGRIHLERMQPEAALAEMERVTAPLWRPYGLALAYHALGRKEESDAALAEFIDGGAAEAAFQIAEVYAFREQPDKAFEWLERAYQQRDGGLAEILSDPLLEGLEGDPRWGAFLEKMGLAG